MTHALVGRRRERDLLNRALASSEAELVAIYGRRRVGKTFLVRQHLDKVLRFELVGSYGATLGEQLGNFSQALGRAMRAPLPPTPPRSWQEAFVQLIAYLEDLPAPRRKHVVFLDELPWLAAPRSRFLAAFEHFWNSWAVKKPWLIVVVCGSAAAWMIGKLLHARGGLHNRITRQIRLEPFDLRDTKQLLKSRGIELSNYQLLELYLALGGVPHYLKQMQRGETPAQCIDRVCFAKDGLLHDEFSRVYASLFDDARHHEAIVRALGKRRRGMTRAELLDDLDLVSGGTISKTLVELEESGFVRRAPRWGYAVKEALYRLTDEFSLFHLTWMEGRRSRARDLWQKKRGTPAWRAWSGYAFEALCAKHVDQLKRALGIEAVETEESAWLHRSADAGPGAQIDLVIDRRDQAINLCEMKFSEGPFTIDKRYAEELRRKREVFRQVTRSRKSLFTTLVTTYGIADGKYAQEIVDASVTMDSLFG